MHFYVHILRVFVTHLHQCDSFQVNLNIMRLNYKYIKERYYDIEKQAFSALKIHERSYLMFLKSS